MDQHIKPRTRSMSAEISQNPDFSRSDRPDAETPLSAKPISWIGSDITSLFFAFSRWPPFGPRLPSPYSRTCRRT